MTVTVEKRPQQQDESEQRPALGSPGMQVLPVFEAVAAEDETVDLISFDTGHPKAVLDWLAVPDPTEERFVWEG
jgi:hypothetical protein